MKLNLLVRRPFLLVPLMLVLASCGSQDPLAKQPEYIKKATPGFDKPAPPVATKENMIISSNATQFFFTEAVEGQTTITGRILLDNYEASMEIDNLEDFEGASFDPATGIFTWTPPRGYVVGVNSTRTSPLRVRLNGLQRQTNITATRTEDFAVTVSRMESQPTIVKETGFPVEAAREGDSLRITIFVKDVDAVNTAGSKPRIFIQSPVNKPSVGDLTPYIRTVSEDNPDQDFSDRTVWKFTLNVALTDADVTKNTGDFYFRVTAVSRYGKMSAPKEYKVSILTGLEKPVLSSDNFEVLAGNTMVHDVLIMDPRQEGKVTVEVLNPQDLPAGFDFKCGSKLASVWMTTCRATWVTKVDPAQQPVTEAVVKLRTTNRSPISYDNFTVSKDYNLNFKVVTP